MLRIRDIIAGSAAGALAVAAAVIGVGGTAASAAEFDYPAAIDPGSIAISTTDGSTSTSVNKQVRIDAAWSVPQGAKAGDTFGFTLPPEFAGAASTLVIPASDDPSVPVAECTISADEAPVVTCTLTDYVDGRDGVSGNLWFMVKTVRATESSTVDFVVDGKTTPVEVPGGGITPGKPMPGEPLKWSSLTEDGRISWVVAVPGSAFADMDSIVIDDQITAPGDGVAEHRNVDGDLQVWATDSTNTVHAEVPGWSGEWNADGTAFHLEIPGPIDASRHYLVRYYTVPTAPVDGATYANTATVNGATVTDTQVWSSSGGGTGTGSETGRFVISKEVSGAATSAVPADTVYTATYSYGDPATTGTMTFTAGQPVVSVPFPAGTVVTLEEIAIPAIDGVEWGTPVFSGDGVRVLDGGRAQLTIGAGASVSVTLTNAASASTPPTPPTPSVPPTAPPELPLTGGLASTGSTAPLPLLYAGAAVVLLGLAMTTRAAVLRRRR